MQDKSLLLFYLFLILLWHSGFRRLKIAVNTDYANGTLVCADEGTVDVYTDSKTGPCVAAGHHTVQEGLSMVSQTTM